MFWAQSRTKPWSFIPVKPYPFEFNLEVFLTLLVPKNRPNPAVYLASACMFFGGKVWYALNSKRQSTYCEDEFWEHGT